MATMVALGLILDWVLALPRYPSPVFLSLAAILIGGALFIEARGTYVLWTVGLGTPNPIEPPKQLVTEGPYRFSRNPLYVARVLALFGVALALGSLGVLFISFFLALGVQLVLLPREERRLSERFGQTYEAYRRRVPKWFSVSASRRRRY